MVREVTEGMTAEIIKAAMVEEAISNKVAMIGAIKVVLEKPMHTTTPMTNSNQVEDATLESTMIVDKVVVEDIKVEGTIDSMVQNKVVLEEVLEGMTSDEMIDETTMAEATNMAIRDDKTIMAVAETTEEIIIAGETSIIKDAKIIMVEDEMIAEMIMADSSNTETMVAVVMNEGMITKEAMVVADHKVVLTTTRKANALKLRHLLT
jgi:hypothetical protein